MEVIKDSIDAPLPLLPRLFRRSPATWISEDIKRAIKDNTHKALREGAKTDYFRK